MSYDSGQVGAGTSANFMSPDSSGTAAVQQPQMDGIATTAVPTNTVIYQVAGPCITDSAPPPTPAEKKNVSVMPTSTVIYQVAGPCITDSALPPTPTAAAPAQPKRSGIYRFTSSRPLFAAGWSSKTDPEKRWRIAVGSVVEDNLHNNRVSIVQMDVERVEFVERFSFKHTFPPNCIQWIPDMTDAYPDLLATSGKCLKIYRVEPNSVILECSLNSEERDYSGPLTSFDWNDVEPTLIGTSSIDNTCTIWQLETGQALAQTKKTTGSVKNQLIAHDNAVHDIKFSRMNNGRDNFATVGEDGSARWFDLRDLKHSAIVYQDPLRRPLMRLALNKQDSHYMATFAQDSTEVFIVDLRMPCVTAARLRRHRACINGIVWAPHSRCFICSVGDDRQALIWDISKTVEDAMLAYEAGGEINQVQWSTLENEYVCICFEKCLEMLRI